MVKRMTCLAAMIVVGQVSALQLITDNQFQTGVDVFDPDTGAVEGSLQYTTTNGSPVWGLRQWNSQNSIYGATPVLLGSSATKWQNIYKIVVMGPTGTVDSDLKLTVNSISEYGSVYRQSGEPWPVLLIQQRISEPNGHIGAVSPWISELTELNYNLDAKLCYANNVYTTGYNPLIHAAQFLNFFTVQNLNKESADYGNYLWFGIRIYDDREALPGLSIKHDIGTDKLIYNIGIEPFCTNGLVVGERKNISGDILPHIKAGLQEAWSQGYLTNSFDYADYKIGGMNMGWEVPGLSTVTMQVSNFGLDAYGLYWPKPYGFSEDGDREGWMPSSLTENNDGPLNGTWIFTASVNDPKLLGSDIRVDSGIYTKVKVRLANAGNPEEASVAQLFWKCDGESTFTEGRSAKVTIGNGGGWVEHTFDMSNDPDWQGEITQLRLDPIYYGDGHAVGIDYIYFSE